MAHDVTFIPGDGTGPELTEATRRVLEATGVHFNWDRQEAGIDEYRAHGDPLPQATLLDVAREVAGDYPAIDFEDVIVDNLCHQLITYPEDFEVIVLTNLYGDIVSDLCAAMIGGLGVAGGANIGTDAAVFEATHGSSPTYAGKNRMNPTALMLSGVYMLDHLRESTAARALENAIAAVIRRGDKVTYDLKASRADPTAVGTSQFADAVIEEMNA